MIQMTLVWQGCASIPAAAPTDATGPPTRYLDPVLPEYRYPTRRKSGQLVLFSVGNILVLPT
jgi:hypothetical protein